ncbi:MAG: divalent-cation tolerance protein CutA [Holosporales bacterium]
MTIAFVYITVDRADVGQSIARLLLQERLVACANLIPGATSFYWWQGQIQESQEQILILKTLKAELDDVTRRIREVHPYECPCIISLDGASAHPDFMHWIEKQVKP